MNKSIEKDKGLSSFIIRILAIISMICSFLANTNIEGIHNPAFADCMYWFSFTIFAFLLSEGVYNTSNKLLYLRRFIVFTAVSEVAYDYYKYGTYWSTKGQSIMLTLLLCLCVMLICDYLNRKFYNTILNIAAVILLSVGIIKLGLYLKCEFINYGVYIAMMFFAARNLSYPKLFQIACVYFSMSYLTYENIISVTINGLQYSLPILVFAVFAMIVTWFYNYKRGPNTIVLKVSFYLVYPLLLIIFYLLKIFVFL